MTTGLAVVLDDWLRPRDVRSGLRRERLGIWYAAKALAESATSENRDFTLEELDLWDWLVEEMTRLDTVLKALGT